MLLSFDKIKNPNFYKNMLNENKNFNLIEVDKYKRLILHNSNYKYNSIFPYGKLYNSTKIISFDSKIKNNIYDDRYILNSSFRNVDKSDILYNNIIEKQNRTKCSNILQALELSLEKNNYEDLEHLFILDVDTRETIIINNNTDLYIQDYENTITNNKISDNDIYIDKKKILYKNNRNSNKWDIYFY